MDLNDYQSAAEKTAIYPETKIIFYPAMGLAGESGEILNKLKKVWRDDKLVDVDELALELGDVLWYVALLASDIGFTLAHIAQMNIDKLTSRQERGVLGGSGDER